MTLGSAALIKGPVTKNSGDLGTTLVCPPLMFSVLLYVEHALGDFLLLKQLVPRR